MVTVTLQSSSLNSSGTVLDGAAPHTQSDQQHTNSARFAKPDYEQLRMLAAMYEAQVPTRRPLSRIAFMIGIFAIGALLGLAGVRWLMPSFGGESVAPFERSVPSSTWPMQKQNRFQASNLTKGISTGELPYDGAPVGQAVGTPPINQEELPYGGLYGGSRTVDQDTSFATVASMNEDAAAKPMEKKAAVQASVGEEKAAKAQQKRRVVQRVAKDKEIERIRQQAAEELKKQSENRRALAAYASSRRLAPRPSSRQSTSQEAPSAASSSSKTRAMLARCEHAANFILREQCKWRLCSGRWGKNGCPSYAAHGSSY